MENKILKKLINSPYRKEMWRNANKIVFRLKKVLPVRAVYLLGSYTTKKQRPADVDFIILIKTKEKKKRSKWSADLVIAPDNRYGKWVLDDAKKWMKQKYGANKSAVIKLK